MPRIPAVTRPFSNRSANRNGRDHLIFEIEMRAFHSLLRLLPKPRLALGMGTVGLVRALDSREIGIERNLPKLTRARKVPAILTLCQAPSPALFLKECHHLLRPEGRIFIGFIPRESPWGRFYMETQKRGRSIPRLAGVYSLNKVEHMIMDAGFSIQGYFSTLFQKPGGVKEIENPMKGYLPQAGFLIIMGERMN